MLACPLLKVTAPCDPNTTPPSLRAKSTVPWLTSAPVLDETSAVRLTEPAPKFALAAGAFVWVPALSTVRVAVMSVPPAAMLAGAGVYSVSPPKLAFTPVRCVPAGIVPSGALATVATPTLGLVSLVVAGIGVLLSSWKETASLPSPAPSQLRVALSGAVPP